MKSYIHVNQVKTLTTLKIVQEEFKKKTNKKQW